MSLPKTLGIGGGGVPAHAGCIGRGGPAQDRLAVGPMNVPTRTHGQPGRHVPLTSGLECGPFWGLRGTTPGRLCF